MTPDIHDVLAWIVLRAARAINWHRAGADGKTAIQRRTGKVFRRAAAPFGQNVLWMPAGKTASRIEAQSRWREGIFWGIFGGGIGVNDCAIGAPGGCPGWARYQAGA